MFKRLLNPVELEEDVLHFWDSERIFERSLEAAKDRPRWVFYEGPPTANGTPHNGHVLTRVIKDVFPRFKSMRGFRVDRKAGWDTHGLPVEVEVEKALDVHGKEAIEAYGLEAFNRHCVDSVFTYINEWEQLTREVGFWVDLDDAYVTYHKTYVESVWWALKRLFDKGLLYQGHKVVWWWPQGGTTLSAGEVGMGYKTVDDPAVTVRFRDAEDPSISYLAWTTTPWTLPSNVALAVGANIEYAYCDEPEGEGTVVVALALAEAHGLVPNRVVKGSDLVGKRYTPLYDFGPPEGGKAFEVVVGHHVTTSAGTGIVHTAPAFGEDDMQVAKDQGLGLLQWIKPDGCFSEGTGFVEGLFCKDADKPIMRELEQRGLMFKKESVRHEYPFCWRKDTDPLIQYARPAWFVKTTEFVEQALENNKQVNWLPDHIQEGRFGDFLRNNVDWALSRERFWGTPLPIWTCAGCEHAEAFDSLKQLAERGAKNLPEGLDNEHLEVHRPWIDDVTVDCPHCDGTLRRVPEVIDCWFDSGCMPFAQWGFPHQNQETFRENYPADFISEAIDQTRGWFYSLLMISTILFDEEACEEFGLDPVGIPRPYKNAVVLGLVADMDGYKESKSKGNYTSPNLVFRGKTIQHALPDDTLKRGSVGLKPLQIKSLDLGSKERISLYKNEGDEPVLLKLVKADIGKKKDTVHLHPDDLAALGLPPEGGPIWFKVPFDPPGADAFRWLFCSASPPWSNTRLSLRAIRDGQREFLLRLRNVAQFFTIYANIAAENGEFDPKGKAPRSPEQRSELDRWILGRLNATVTIVTNDMEDFQLYTAARALSTFVDDLSNWYVRRSRSRFWSEGAPMQDALWTLYEVLCMLSRVIAPFVPFTAEALYQSLERGPLGDAAEPSVHLNAWPTELPALDAELDAHMAILREVASLGLAARTASKVKVRQPLRGITVVLADPAQAVAVRRLESLLLEELNVREVNFTEDADALVHWQVKPDFKKLGRKLGKDMKACAAALGKLDGSTAKAALDAGTLTVDLGHRVIDLGPEDVTIQVVPQGHFEAASSSTAVVALDTALDEELLAMGLVRELTSRVQGLRKELDLGYTQRIRLRLSGDAPLQSALAVSDNQAVLQGETLISELIIGLDGSDDWQSWDLDVEGHKATVRIQAL